MNSTAQQLDQFTDAIYAAQDIVEVRRIRSEDVICSWHSAATLPDMAEELANENPQGWNIYAGINPRDQFGAKSDAAIPLARTVFVDQDDIDAHAAISRWPSSGLPQPTVFISSGHGLHSYFSLIEPVADLAAWRELQWDLAVALAGDVKVRNPERIMRLPGFLNVKRQPYVPCEIIECDPGRRFSFAELRAIVKPRPKVVRAQRTFTPIASASRDQALKRCRAYLAKCPEAISRNDGHGKTFRAAMECFRFGLDVSDVSDLMEWFNTHKCQPEWSPKELAHKIDEAHKKIGAEFGCRLHERQKIHQPAQRRRRFYLITAGAA